MAINTHLSWKNSGLLVDLFQLWLAWYWLAIYSAIFFAAFVGFGWSLL
jgi:hypothetical protein